MFSSFSNIRALALNFHHWRIRTHIILKTTLSLTIEVLTTVSSGRLYLFFLAFISWIRHPFFTYFSNLLLYIYKKTPDKKLIYFILTMFQSYFKTTLLSSCAASWSVSNHSRGWKRHAYIKLLEDMINYATINSRKFFFHITNSLTYKSIRLSAIFFFIFKELFTNTID